MVLAAEFPVDGLGFVFSSDEIVVADPEVPLMAPAFASTVLMFLCVCRIASPIMFW